MVLPGVDQIVNEVVSLLSDKILGSGVAGSVSNVIAANLKNTLQGIITNSPRTASDCQTQGDAYLAKIGKRAGRIMQSGDWGHVPPGCSVQSGNDWAIHWNTSSTGGSDPGFTPVPGTGMLNTFGGLGDVIKGSVNPVDLANQIRGSVNPVDLANQIRGSVNPVDLANQIRNTVNPTNLANLIKDGINPANIASTISKPIVDIVSAISGAPNSQSACEAAANAQLRRLGKPDSAVVAGSWSWVPPGCSLQYNTTTHWNTNSNGSDSSGVYTPVKGIIDPASLGNTIVSQVTGAVGGLGNTIASQFTGALTGLGDTILQTISDAFGKIDVNAKPLSGSPMVQVKLYNVAAHPKLYQGSYKSKAFAPGAYLNAVYKSDLNRKTVYDTPFFFLDGAEHPTPFAPLSSADPELLKGYSGDFPIELTERATLSGGGPSANVYQIALGDINRTPLGIDFSSISSNLGKIGDLIGNRISSTIGGAFGTTFTDQLTTIFSDIASTFGDTLGSLGSVIGDSFLGVLGEAGLRSKQLSGAGLRGAPLRGHFQKRLEARKKIKKDRARTHRKLKLSAANSMKLGAVTDDIISGIKSIGESIGGGLLETIESMGSGIGTDIMDQLKNLGVDIGGGLFDQLSDIGGVIGSGLFDTMKDALSYVQENVAGNLTEYISNIANKLYSTFVETGLGDFMKMGTTGIKYIFSMITGILRSILSNTLNVINMVVINGVMQAKTVIIDQILNRVLQVINTLEKTIMANIKGLVQDAVKVFDSMKSEIFKTIQTAGDGINQTFTGVTNQMFDFMKDNYGMVQSTLNMVTPQIKSVAADAMKSVREIASELGSSLTDVFSFFYAEFESYVAAAMSGVRSQLSIITAPINFVKSFAKFTKDNIVLVLFAAAVVALLVFLKYTHIL